MATGVNVSRNTFYTIDTCILNANIDTCTFPDTVINKTISSSMTNEWKRWSGGLDIVLGNITVGGYVLSTKSVEASTAGSASPNVITAAKSNTAYTNEGSTALNYHTLPAAAANLTYTFYVDDADGIRVVAGAGDIIQINGVVSSVAGYCESTTIGSTVTLLAINATDWVAISSLGTWTLA
jgi:hypothetical protein